MVVALVERREGEGEGEESLFARREDIVANKDVIFESSFQSRERKEQQEECTEKRTALAL